MTTGSNIVRLQPETTTAALAPEGISKVPQRERSVHPHTLLVHWEIYFRADNWQAAHHVAEALILDMPDEPIGWIYRSFALKQMKQTDEAANQLLPAAERFSDDWRISYNLACYHAELGDLASAWHWLDHAIEIGDVEQIKQEALSEPALEPLWARL